MNCARVVFAIKLLFLIVTVGFSVAGIADSWAFKKELKEETFTFGDTEVHRIIDTRDNSHTPTFRIRVKYKGIEEALYKNLTFDKVVTFDRGNYILGVSNSGLSKFAYFILGNQGELIKAVNHHSSGIHYCRQSVTLVREWVSEDNPAVITKYKTEKNGAGTDQQANLLISATIVGCDGRNIEIWSN